jgi:hypothetical protein
MADNKRKTQEILELELQVKEQEAMRSLRNVIKTSEELTKTSVDGNKETKKYVDALLQSVKDVGDQYGKTSKRYKSALTSTQKALESAKKGEQSALKVQMKRLQKTEGEIKRTQELALAADAIADALKEQVKLKAQLISDDQEREKFLEKELNNVEQIVSARKKEALALRGNRQALKEMTRESSSIKQNARDFAKSTRGTRLANNTGRAISAGGRGVMTTVDALKGGYSRQAVDSLVQGLKGASSRAAGRLGAASQSLGGGGGALAQTAGKLVGIFSKLSAAVSTATRFLGWFAAAITVAIEADARQKEVNKALSRGLGSASLKGGDLSRLGNFITNKSLTSNPMVGGLRLNSEEMIEGANALMQSGVNVKNLSNGFKGFTSIMDTTAIASRNFGIEMSDAGKMVGDYFDAFGSGSEKIKDVFATLNKDIKSSSMTTTQFLSTIQSVSAQFNLFLDQTKEFSGILGKMSSGGAFTGKQLNKLVSSLAGFGPKTVDEGIKAMALYGPEIQRQAAIEMSSVQKRLRGGTYGSEAERQQDLRRLEALQVVQRGGLNAGGAVKDALGSMGMLGAFLENQGIQTFGQMRDARNNVEQVKLMAGISGLSDDEVRDTLEAASTLMETQNQTFAQVLSGNRSGLMEKVGQVTAEREAANIAGNTITRLSGMQDVGNAILYKIADLMQRVYNVLVEVGKSIVKNVNPLNWFQKDEGKLVDREGLQQGVADSYSEAKGAKAIKEAISGGAVTGARGLSTTNRLLGQKILGGGMKSRIVAPSLPKPATTTTGTAGVSGGGTTTYPAGEDVSTAAGAAAANMPQINMSAILQLPDNKPIELIVKKVLFERDQRR